MSRPATATDNTLPGPLVTPAASAQHDCSADVDVQRRDKQRRHQPHDQLMHQDVPQALSPSRAESPTAHQWSKPTPGFSLKRASTIPLEKLSRPDNSQSPQLSERDSIFATHYLPSDSDASTPRLPPVQDADSERHVSLIPKLEGAPASPSPVNKAPYRTPVDTSLMEVDIRRDHPFRPSFRPSPDVTHSSLLSAAGSHVGWAKQQDTGEISQIPLWETLHPLRKITSHDAGSKTSVLEDSRPDRSLLPSALSDSSLSSRPQMISSLGHELSVADRETAPHPWRRDSGPEGEREVTLERSSSTGRRGRVENSIEASLTNAELAAHVRSRKSSHYLGLFKENTTSPDRKRRDDRVKKHGELFDQQDRTDHPDDESQLDLPPSTDGTALYPSKAMSHIPLLEAPSVEQISDAEPPQHQQGVVSPTKRHQRSLPRSLLEEIRNFHLTPGGARGTSFSKSIPTQFAEGGREYVRKDASFESLSPGSDVSRQPCRGSGQFEDEEDEQISSALYFPHERVAVPEEVDQFRDFHDDQDVSQPLMEDRHNLMPTGRSTPNDQEIGHVDISLRSKNESRILHGELQEIKTPLPQLTEKSLATMSERSYDSTCESELASADESGLSVREEESSLTDDAEMTPTATPTQRQRYLRPRRKHSTAAPLGAVELKPYRHQVGGHTTVFRFSRRAVCKQLNNRENEFYERIERRHPEMLMFLPRYIGVLNVTFSKNPKRPKARAEGHPEHTDVENVNDSINGAKAKDQVIDGKSKTSENPEQPRIFSQKQVTGVIPQVILENNRHIIPADLFSRHQRPRTTDNVAVDTHRFSNDKLLQRHSMGDKTTPPPLKRHNNSWGATTVNRKLQEQVLREVFSPPAIHHHRRHARGHLNLPRTSSDGDRRRGNISEDRTSSSRRHEAAETEPPRSAAIDIATAANERPALSSSASTALEANHSRLEKIRTEEAPPRASSLSRTRQVRRRHSGSGLQRKGSIHSRDRGDLMFFEDDGYGGDGEDEIFAMEGDASTNPRSSGTPESSTLEGDTSGNSHGMDSAVVPVPRTPRLQQSDHHPVHLPSNPKEAQTRKDDRVQFFLLLEDLTAGMNKPCVLDLKMGTRQYGIEADEKKKKSQRRKCQTTTSQQLGVRLCGMQTWNVKKQEYLFEDKYFGRDLKSGREFQDALTRFLFDGVSYRSVAKKIPVILDKLSKLENMIRRLKRYRLYASSLLILYDGEQSSASANDEAHTKSTKPGERAPLHRRNSDDGHNNSDVQLKIVDFANCVTGEDELPPDAPCPPHHPDDIDRGYLRGLRSLRMYFQRILKEVSQDDFVERGEGEAMAIGPRSSGREVPTERYWDEGVMESDPGEVSF